MSFITYLVLQRLKTYLTREMQTRIPTSDLTRAAEVKIGRYQDNPIPDKVYLAIQGGTLEDPELMDGIVTIRNMEQIGLSFPPREIGGGQLWWRRGTVRIGCFYVMDRLEEEQAAEKAYTVLGRALNLIETVPVADLVDSSGERALAIYAFGNSYAESGGSSQYIWRGTIKFQVLTERP